MIQWARMRARSLISICASPPYLLLRPLYADARRHMRAGFCNVRALEIYFHTGRRRCHLTTMMLMTAMMSWWILQAKRRSRMTRMSRRAQANPDLTCFISHNLSTPGPRRHREDWLAYCSMLWAEYIVHPLFELYSRYYVTVFLQIH